MDFPFTFPVISSDGYQMAEIEGTADIQIDDNGDWFVASIGIHECKRSGRTIIHRTRTITRDNIGMTEADVNRQLFRHVEIDCAEEIEETLWEQSHRPVRELGDGHLQRELV